MPVPRGEWDPNAPFEIAPRIWWVGAVLVGERFQCHSYLIEAGENSVLIDPGSPVTIEETLDKVRRIVPLGSVRWVVCLHSDPDVAGCVKHLGEVLTHPEARIVCEWRSATMIHHYDSALPIQHVEDLDWAIQLDESRALRFLLTPYLHYPGAIVAYDDSTGVLFSSDLFGGFSDGTTYVASDADACFEGMRLFHEHYMPGREILANGLARILRAFDPIELVAPQHGLMIPGPLVDEVFEKLSRLECGLFLIAHDDEDVAELLRYSTALRRIQAMATELNDLQELMDRLENQVRELVSLRSASLVLDDDFSGVLRMVGSQSRTQEIGATSEVRTQEVGERHWFPIPGPGARAELELELSSGVVMSGELKSMLEQAATMLRGPLDRHLDRRRTRRETEHLRAKAVIDPLTSVFNRHVIDTIDEDDPHAVMLVDVDRFKEVNDSFGHSVGDEVLRRVADTAVGVVRECDLVVRFGGDELMLIVSTAGRELASDVANRLRTQVSDLSMEDLAGGLSVTLSVGVAMHEAGSPFFAAMRCADEALYDAKRSGRDRVELYWNRSIDDRGRDAETHREPSWAHRVGNGGSGRLGR